MIIFVNGERRELREGATVAALVADTAGVPDGRGLAVAVDAEVVPRSAWERRQLADGERVEILAAIQGG